MVPFGTVSKYHMMHMRSAKREKTKKIVCTEPARLPTRLGTWMAVAFRSATGRREGDTHVALFLQGPGGDLAGAKSVLVRVQSECLTSEVFGSRKCDCADQLKAAMRAIRKAGRGVVVYLRQEGRGIGIFAKLRAYHLQDHGFDTVEANEQLGVPQDSREYSAAAAILKHLGVESARLMTNNPAKIAGLRKEGITVSVRIPLVTKPDRWNREYLRVKRKKMGHLLGKNS